MYVLEWACPPYGLRALLSKERTVQIMGGKQGGTGGTGVVQSVGGARREVFDVGAGLKTPVVRKGLHFSLEASPASWDWALSGADLITWGFKME